MSDRNLAALVANRIGSSIPEVKLILIVGYRRSGYYLVPIAAYACVSEEGEIVDSLQLIHNNLMREGGRTWARWSFVKIIVSAVGDVVAIWEDHRHSDYPIGSELYMRYSRVPESIRVEELQPLQQLLLESIYPNPFNRGTMVRILTRTNQNIQFIVNDMSGRQITHTTVVGNGNGRIAYYWEARDQTGLPLPAGSYMLTFSESGINQTRIVTLIR